ncbi:MAG: hypothetical protein Greene041619_555 [Candidatus Peregrinibacteria bacterium Greene0416_19]|nr:MAG: hypothetical protein Greene041619_555 [Candidatus Peregrinibacteria bacterium Greene0416_19]
MPLPLLRCIAALLLVVVLPPVPVAARLLADYKKTGAPVYLPFTRRNAEVPLGWEATVTKEKAAFRKAGFPSTFTVLPFPIGKCSVDGIQALLEQRFPGQLTEADKAVGLMRLPGVLAGGFSWTQTSEAGTMKHVCVSPPGRVDLSETVYLASDKVAEAGAKLVLPQLIKPIKRTR